MNVDRELMFFEVILLRDSERAILVSYQPRDGRPTEEIWLPKSMIVWEEVELGQQTEVQVPVWLARANKMI